MILIKKKSSHKLNMKQEEKKKEVIENFDPIIDFQEDGFGAAMALSS